MTTKAVKLHSSANHTESTFYGSQDIKQEATSYPCEVRGTIPSWLEGTIYKQAGGAFGKKQNQLDGLAHLASFRIEDGRAFFSNKYMRTKDFVNFVNTGNRGWSGTGISEKPSRFAAIKELLFGYKSNSTSLAALYNDFNPNVTTWLLENGQKIGAQTEVGGKICLVDPATLDTVSELKTLQPVHNGVLISTPAHYFREGSQGGYHVALELHYTFRTVIPTFTLFYNVYYGDVAPFKCQYSSQICKFRYDQVSKANKKLKERPSYMHTLAVTEEYVVLIETSLKYDLAKLLKKDFSEGVFGMFPVEDIPVTFTILKRGKEKLKFFKKIESSYKGMVWHIGNCYQTGGDIVLEAGCSANAKTARNFFSRFVIDVEKESVQHMRLFENCEFPVINPNYLMKPNQFSYIVKDFLKNATLVKLESEPGREVKVCFEAFMDEGVLASEPCFVPKPGGSSEDDGVVLCMITDCNKEISFLAVVDGISGDVLAEAYAPVPINKGLHSIFVPKRGLETFVSKL